jgi:cytochrome c556
MSTYTNKRNSSSHRGQEDCKVKLNRQGHKERQEASLRIVVGILLSDLFLSGLGDLGGSMTRLGSYLGHHNLVKGLLGYVFLVMFFLFSSGGADVRGEDFAQPPQWSSEVKGVFFDDARKELKGEPSTQANADSSERPGAAVAPTEQAIWRELITPETLEAIVKERVLVLGHFLRLMQVPSDSQKVHPNECRREFTMLGTLFQVIGSYPDDVRWKSIAPQMSQMCLKTAEFYAGETHVSITKLYDAYATLEDALRGQADITSEPNAEPLAPEFAPLMQWMKSIVEGWLPTVLSKKADFRRNVEPIAQSAQLLAMLSQVIRGEEYGYADDETYQHHADKLRDAAKQLNEAAAAEEFDKAVKAAAAIQKSCADCHADFRG